MIEKIIVDTNGKTICYLDDNQWPEIGEILVVNGKNEKVISVQDERVRETKMSLSGVAGFIETFSGRLIVEI
jgi:hypothetical protein